MHIPYPMEDCTHDQTTEICACGLGVGEMQIRHRVLCYVDTRGRLYLTAPRGADVALAKRVVATMAGATDDTSRQLAANLVGVREKA